MKFKYLIASVALIVGVAAYTLTLSFTETDLMSQLEALADGEDGEAGNGETGEAGGENPESGKSEEYGLIETTQMYCQRYGRTIDGRVLPIGEPGYFPIVLCYKGKGVCIVSNPCEILPLP